MLKHQSIISYQLCENLAKFFLKLYEQTSTQKTFIFIFYMRVFSINVVLKCKKKEKKNYEH